MNIPFWLDGTAAPLPQLDYLPYGTRSLRIEVRTNRPMPALRLRPHHRLPEESANGIFRGFEDGGTTFQLSWGGGHEAGPCARTEDRFGAFEVSAAVPAGHQQIIIFNLSHMGEALPETVVLTLEAFEEATGQVHAQLPITLRRPANLPASIGRLTRAAHGREWQLQAGTHLPRYESRWWPEQAVSYTAAPTSLPLRVVHDAEAAVLNVYWGETLTAVIEDHTTPSVLETKGVQCDLFSFSESYIGLRVWFFWLDVNMGHGFFIGRHEVPDAERFDLLIRLWDGKVGLACTDLHWRESWGVCEKTPQRATLGLTREAKIKLVQTGLEKMWSKWQGEGKQAAVPSYNPLGYIQRRAKLEARNTKFVVRAHGTEAHIPLLADLLADTDSFFSSDVRLGG